MTPCAAEKISRTKDSGDALSMPATGALDSRIKSHQNPMSITSTPTRRFPADLITKSWESLPRCRLNIAAPEYSVAEFQSRLKWWNEHFLFQSLDRFQRNSFGVRYRNPGINIARRRIVMAITIGHTRRHRQVEGDL